MVYIHWVEDNSNFSFSGLINKGWHSKPGTSRQREAGVEKDERRVAGRERKDAMFGKSSINSESQMFGTKKGAKLNWEEFRCVWTKKLGCFSSHVATSLAVRWRKFISITIWESESVCFIISTYEKLRVFILCFLQVILESESVYLMLPVSYLRKFIFLQH